MKNTMFLAGLMSCAVSAALGQTQLIINGGFESQNAGEWQISGLGAGIRDNPNIAYDGIGYLALGGASAGNLQTVYQTITIPNNTVAAELTYYYNVFSSSLSSSDQFGAFILNPVNGTVVATVNEVSGANSAGGEGPSFYQQVTFDLTGWAGQTIDLEFQASSSSATVFNVDDVSVWVETTADTTRNDYFTNRTVLTGTSLTVQGNNTFATTEPGEPNILGHPPFNSLWWSWTAPSNGTLSLNTYATSFANLLAVYTGASLNNLTQVGAAVSANENGNLAQVTVLVNAGTQYQIAVDGLDGAYGTLVLDLTFVPNGSGITATATATLLNDFVVGATITDGGFGYTNTPAVRIIGGGGSGAQAVAVVSNGVVVAVNVLEAGDGYTNAPAIVIAPPFIPRPTMDIAPMSLLTFTDLTLGTNYQLQFFSGSTWSNIGAAFTAAGPTFTQYVSGTASANSHRLAATPIPSQAYATAQVVNGFVVGATVTNGGSGYGSEVVVTILSNGGGSNAAAVATVSGGTVTGITITSAGTGYTNAPTIIIAPPQGSALLYLWPMVAQAMELDLRSLSPYDNYQVQFAPVANGGWNNLGAPFTPTAITSTQYINVDGNAGFFRAMYVP